MIHITLDDIKNHLNIDNDIDDVYLNDLIAVAEDAVATYLNRSLSDEFCLVSGGELRPAIKHSIRLLVGTWYASRESISFGNAVEVPYSVAYLLTPLKQY